MCTILESSNDTLLAIMISISVLINKGKVGEGRPRSEVLYWVTPQTRDGLNKYHTEKKKTDKTRSTLLKLHFQEVKKKRSRENVLHK